MIRFLDWFYETAVDILVGLAIYGLTRLVERRNGMEWAEIFHFIRQRNATRLPRWGS